MGTDFWSFGLRGGQVRQPPSTTRPESFGYGPFPADSTPPEGVKTVKNKDGTYYILPGSTGAGASAAMSAIDSTIGGGTNAAASAPKQAVGGYEIGQTYNGYEYLGGDPDKEENWKQP
jgi:hypothetical protein